MVWMVSGPARASGRGGGERGKKIVVSLTRGDGFSQSVLAIKILPRSPFFIFPNNFSKNIFEIFPIEFQLGSNSP